MEDAQALSVIRRYLLGIRALVVLGLLIELFTIHCAFYVADQRDKAHGKRGLEHEVPPLAAAAMLPLGFLGIAFTFRHPLLEEDFGRTFQSITRA